MEQPITRRGLSSELEGKLKPGESVPASSEIVESKRSLALITDDDLAHLRSIAWKCLEYRLSRNGHLRDFRERLVCIALCQGAALHYVNGKTGVKDFDVSAFFTTVNAPTLGFRRGSVRESGLHKFGKHPDVPRRRGYKTRWCDFFMRAITPRDVDRARAMTDEYVEGDAVALVRGYLIHGATSTARFLAKKAVVGLWPDSNVSQTPRDRSAGRTA